MSIAVSAIVRPSPGLRLLHAGFCGCVLASSLGCEGWLLRAVCVVAAAAGWWLGRGAATVRQLDISGVGEPRLTVYQQTGGAEAAAGTPRLLAGSTLWPGLLLLRFTRAGAPVQTLIVLPDSVAPGAFRALALACRAIAGRGRPPEI
jgi:toxin CptA